jgi:hypothetical protein
MYQERITLQQTHYLDHPELTQAKTTTNK